MWWNDVTVKGLRKSVKHTKCQSPLAYDESTMKWWNEQWNDETNDEMIKP